MSTPILFLAYALLQVVAVVFAFRAIRSARTSQGTAAWVVFLIAVPILAVPAFLFLGSWRFEGYVVARRETDAVVEGIDAYRRTHAREGSERNGLHKTLERLSELPIVAGNAVDLLIDGEATFDAIFAALDEAQSYVLSQFYIVKDDDLGRAYKDRLVACAKRGVEVYFLYDAVGSHALSKTYIEELSDAGVTTINVYVKRGPKYRFQINFRNHRKTVVIDGKYGFTGGLNVGNEYMSRDDFFGYWRDTHCRIEGPLVSQLQLIFVEDWYWSSGTMLADHLHWESEPQDADVDGVFVATGPADEEESGALFFLAMIQAAERRLWIASPYMVPEHDVLMALKLAAMRGVEVKLMIPDVVDHWLPWLAAFAYVDELNASGVEVWRYKGGFMHQKVLLVDDHVSAIGTSNLDNRSFRLNFEAMAVFLNEKFARETHDMLERDFEACARQLKPLKEERLFVRLFAPIARLFAPLL